MREIKFRAWDINPETQQGHFEYSAHLGCEAFFHYFEFEEDPIMQYTGLTDKNGKEIYEGDIAVYPDKSGGEIVFSLGCFHFAKDTQLPSALGVHANDIEVIGNIYENGDLLNAK